MLVLFVDRVGSIVLHSICFVQGLAFNLRRCDRRMVRRDKFFRSARRNWITRRCNGLFRSSRLAFQVDLQPLNLSLCRYDSLINCAFGKLGGS